MADDTPQKFDDRYVGYREHAAAQQRTDAELARIRERQATTEATLLHEVGAVRADVLEVKQLMLRPPPPPPQQQPVDHMALAMQRFADIAERQKQGGPSSFLLAFAIIGALAAGFIAARFLIG